MNEQVFARTPRGSANVRIFYGADLLVFCEGSSSNQVDDEEPDYYGVDHRFWLHILGEKFPEKKIVIRPVGSKDQVLEQARGAREGEIAQALPSAVLACIDRDYDDLVGLTDTYDKNLPLMMTYGYSVENDLFCSLKPSDLIDALFPRMGANPRKRASQALSILLRTFKKAVQIDCYFRKANFSMLPTEGVPSFVQEVRTFDDIKLLRMNGFFLKARRRRFSQIGVRNYSEFRQKMGLVGFVRPQKDIRGSCDVPGKTLFKSVSELLNRLGKHSPKWNAIGMERLHDITLSIFLSKAPLSNRLLNFPERAYSWTTS